MPFYNSRLIYRSVLLILLVLVIQACQGNDPVKNSSDQGKPRQSDSPIIAPQSPDTGRSAPAGTESLSLPLRQPNLKLIPVNITRSNGDSFTLDVPQGYSISLAWQTGMKRPRFMAMSPDNRLFLTDLYALTDNTEGRVLILEGFDQKTGTFSSVFTYLSGLRNPNSVAFYQEDNGKQWIYVALTEKLVRYPYHSGDRIPAGPPQVLATFPDYGLSYKYGGWHLTRTLAVHNGKIYIAVGSSCNSCEETEPIRATISVMDPDGRNHRVIAKGLRNSVGLRWVGDTLFATDMGSDHFGTERPDDRLFRIREGVHYGWPYVYQYSGRKYIDSQYINSTSSISPETVPFGYAAFPAHSAPLGLDYFGQNFRDSRLKGRFLVALHGSSIVKMKKGYAIVRVGENTVPQPFISGFLKPGGKRVGRPCDILRLDDKSFFFTDDHGGLLYYVKATGKGQ